MHPQNRMYCINNIFWQSKKLWQRNIIKLKLHLLRKQKEDIKKKDLDIEKTKSKITFKSKEQIMKCWHCKTELLWAGDHDLDDREYDMVTHLDCPNCGSYVEVYNKREGWQERILEN